MTRILLLTNNTEVAQPLYEWLQEQEGKNSVILWGNPLTPDLFQAGSPLEGVDFIVSYGYRHIIRNDVLGLFTDRIANLHISLLPWNRGADPNFWSFIEDTPKGVTVHLVDEGLDTGNILIQQECFFNEDQETFVSSYSKLHEEIQSLFKLHWTDIKHGRIGPVPQEGIGSVHRKAQLREFVARFPVDWSDNVARYKLSCRNRGDALK